MSVKIKHSGFEFIQEIDQQLLYEKVMISIENVNISKTNIWDDDIILKAELIDEDGGDVGYRIMMGEVEVAYSNLSQAPRNINLGISRDYFNVGENILKIVAFDENGVESSYEYLIIGEDRDTFTFLRRFDFKEEYITDPNIDVIYGEGLALKDIGAGEVSLEIPTEGKSTIKSITVEGAEDTIVYDTVEGGMELMKNLGGGAEYRYGVNFKHLTINNIQIELREEGSE